MLFVFHHSNIPSFQLLCEHAMWASPLWGATKSWSSGPGFFTNAKKRGLHTAIHASLFLEATSPNGRSMRYQECVAAYSWLVLVRL